MSDVPVKLVTRDALLHILKQQETRVCWIDIRPAAQFAIQHLRACFSLPADVFAQRSHELPPRGRPLALIGDDEASIHDICKRFDMYDYEACCVLAADDWLVLQQQQPDLLSSDVSLQSQPRFWEPSPLVTRIVGEYQSNFKGGYCLDLGCGVGRNAVFLAEHGLHVVAVDNRKPLVDKCVNFAERYGVGELVQGIVADVDDLQPQTQPKFALVLAVRFLHHPFFSRVSEFMCEGGLFVIEHFCVGCELSAVGRPSKRNQLIGPGEVLDLLSRNCPSGYQWEVLMEENSVIEDGRPVIHCVARYCKKSV
jgi:SAM-dependent methyltransferase